MVFQFSTDLCKQNRYLLPLPGAAVKSRPPMYRQPKRRSPLLPRRGLREVSAQKGGLAASGSGRLDVFDASCTFDIHFLSSIELMTNFEKLDAMSFLMLVEGNRH